MQKYIVLFIVTLFLISTVAAEGELSNPGIKPNSPFYFADKLFDVFQSVESVVNERAAEVIAMAKENHKKGLEKALEGYDKALSKREDKAENNENDAESLARQSARHLEALAVVRDKVPEDVKVKIDEAMNRSAQGLDKGLSELKKQNPELAASIALDTLNRVLENAPEKAKNGLMTALEVVQRHGAAVDTGKPDDADGKKPEDVGKPDNLPSGSAPLHPFNKEIPASKGTIKVV